MAIQSIKKLENIADFLKNSGKKLFQNDALTLFVNYIENEPNLLSIIDILADKNKSHYNEMIKFFKGDCYNYFFDYRKNNIKSFDEYVACCWFYLKYISLIFHGDPIIDKFIGPIYDKSNNDDEKQKLLFYHECVNPIILYIKLQQDHFVNAISILKRYKILCEWYDREQVANEKELQLTNGHLNKYLFEQGFTYSLTETNTNSGRIDNFAFSINASAEQLKELPDVIVIEGKIFKGTTKIFSEVFEQVRKRLNDFNLLDGYCVIYNKTNNSINLLDKSEEIAGIPYLSVDNKKIFFIVINLGADFLNSTKKLKGIDINIKV